MKNGKNNDQHWASDFNITEAKRFSRQVIVPHIGRDGQQNLFEKRVLIVGLGGLGCPLSMYLVMSGQKHVGIVDFDRIEVHNLQRQSLYGEQDIGRYKCDVAAERLRAIWTDVEIEAFNTRIDSTNVDEIVRRYDVIVDCCDSISTRYLLNDSAVIHGKALVSASVLKWEGQLFVMPPGGNCYRCMFPEPKTAAANCALAGVASAMCGIVGCMQAAETMKIVMGTMEENTRSSFIIFNGWSSVFKKVTVNREKCRLCRGEAQSTSQQEPSCSEMQNTQTSSQNPTITWETILASPESYCVIDIRTDPHFSLFRYKHAVNFSNASDRIDEICDFAQRHKDKKIVVSCYKGISSMKISDTLGQRGLDAVSVVGGIERFKELVGYEML